MSHCDAIVRQGKLICMLSVRPKICVSHQSALLRKKRQAIDYCKLSLLNCQPPLGSAATVAMPTLCEVSCRGGQKRMLAPLVVRTVSALVDSCTQGRLYDYKKRQLKKNKNGHPRTQPERKFIESLELGHKRADCIPGFLLQLEVIGVLNRLERKDEQEDRQSNKIIHLH